MARQARIDSPGLLHHIIARGINRRAVFVEKADYVDFLERIDSSLKKSSNQILAWVLMPNHFHLLVRSGPHGIVPFMRSLMTGYAGAFNRRHRRIGHLFQNRYKSIVCEENAYLLELVRYIHLNPLRGHLVADLRALAYFPYSGHGVLFGKLKAPWHATGEVLSLFSNDFYQARKNYLKFMSLGVDQGERVDLVGGGLGRSLGAGPREVPAGFQRERQVYDSRILGGTDFVQKVLKKVENEEVVHKTIFRQKSNLNDLAVQVAKIREIDRRLMIQKNRMDNVSKAKALFSYLAVEYLGTSQAEIGRYIKMTSAAVGRARLRGFNLSLTYDWKHLLKVN